MYRDVLENHAQYTEALSPFRKMMTMQGTKMYRWLMVCILVMGISVPHLAFAKKVKVVAKAKTKKQTTGKKARKHRSRRRHKKTIATKTITKAIILAKPKNPAEARAMSRLSHRINRFLRIRSLRRAKLGVIVMTPTGRVLYAKNANKQYIPASNLKLLTLATSLKYLGYHYRFKTFIRTDKPIDENGVLNGHLYIKGGGDPTLRSEELWRIVRDLYMKGLRKIKGRVIFDVSVFDRKRFGAGWTDHSNQPREKYRPYLAPIGGLTLNYSTVAISVRPGLVVGNPARIMLDPNSFYFRKIINKTKTVSARGSFKVRFRILPHRGYRDQVEVTGTIPINRKAKSFWRRINFPGWYAAFQFAHVLRKQGIRVSRWPRRGKAPGKSSTLYTHFSRPLGQILQYVGKQSSNFTTEQIVKKMGALRYGTPGTWAKGIRVVKSYLQKFGLKPNRYTMINGSGLGRANRLSPFQLATILRKMLADYRSRPEYLAAQATSGTDGTLRWRMRDRVTRGKIRGKTGSLDGVSTISGYVLTRENKMLIFSILMNGKLRQGRHFRRVQNQIGRLLARFPKI